VRASALLLYVRASALLLYVRASALLLYVRASALLLDLPAHDELTLLAHSRRAYFAGALTTSLLCWRTHDELTLLAHSRRAYALEPGLLKWETYLILVLYLIVIL